MTADVPARHRAAEDRAQRHQRVPDRGRVGAVGEQPVGEVLQVGAANLGELAGAERREHAQAQRRLVAADDARLVPVAGPVADAAVASAGKPRLGGLAESDLARRPHRASADLRLRLGAPRLRLGQRRERLLDPPPVACAPDARLVGRPAVALRAVTGGAELAVPKLDARMPCHEADRSTSARQSRDSRLSRQADSSGCQRSRADAARVTGAARETLQRALFFVNGAAQESNLPSVGLPRLTGFEDRLGHRARAAPQASYQAKTRPLGLGARGDWKSRWSMTGVGQIA